MLYGEISNVLLQLSCPEFLAIGSLAQTEEATWEVKYCPLTIRTDVLVSRASMPRSKLLAPDAMFKKSSDYYKHLADQHLKHLCHKRSDAMDEETDCRHKFVAGKLSQKLARNDKLASLAYRAGPFKL